MNATEEHDDWEVLNDSADISSERVPFVELATSAPEPVEDFNKEQKQSASSFSRDRLHVQDIEQNSATLVAEDKSTANSASEEDKEVNINSEVASDEDAIPSEVNVGASIAAGAVSGLLLGGPILSIIGAAGAGMYATEEGMVGDVVRAGGEVAVSCRDRAVRLDKTHGCVSKAKDAIEAVGHKINEVGKESKTWVKVRACAGSVGSKAKDIESEHHFLESILTGMSKGLASLAERLSNPPPRNDDVTTSESMPPPGATVAVLHTATALSADDAPVLV